MELVSQTTMWSCYRPNKEFSTGHMVFYFNDKNNLEHGRQTVGAAIKYGRLLVDSGFAKDYYMLAMTDAVHIAPRYNDMEETHMADFMDFIKKDICQN